MNEMPSYYNGQQESGTLYVNGDFSADYPAAQTSFGSNPVMSQRTVEAIIKSDHDTFNAVEKRRMMNMLDYYNFKSRLEYREEMRIRKELSATSIYWDAKGELKVEIISPNGSIRSEKLCNLRKLETMTTLYKPMDAACLEKSIYVVSYQVGENYYSIPISAEDYGKGKLLKKMRYNGIFFYISHKKLDEIACDFEAFILGEAKEEMIPIAFGWFFYDGKWRYASEKILIWEDVKNGKH
ncbi:hypothetical protein [Lacrimispora celerecrescens]|uniref:hypothetical protein n=1 Tax=Lacrimispora celerecrescens TaxID=29354 RepID=UPI001649088B|nr:hypothetical protein [Lacrimispora celerecrescens]